MNLKKKSFILAITLLLGIVFLPGVTKAALENPFDGPYVSTTLYIQDEFINEGQYPFDIQTAEGSWAKGGIENFFLDTYINSIDSWAQVDVNWYVDQSDSPIEVHLSFNYQVEENSIISYTIPGEFGELDLDEAFFHRTFTMDSKDNNMVSLTMINNGGRVFISDFQGLPLPTEVHTPVPASVLLLGTGLIGLAALGRRRRNR